MRGSAKIGSKTSRPTVSERAGRAGVKSFAGPRLRCRQLRGIIGRDPVFPGEASARGTKANQRQFHPKPSKGRAALLLRRLGH